MLGKLNVLIFLISVVVSFGWAQSFTASEGLISSRHDNEFYRLREKYVITNGTLDSKKIQMAIDFLTAKRKSLEDSVYMQKKIDHINRRGYSDKKSSKEAAEELEHVSEYLGVFDFAIDQFKQLVKLGPVPINFELQDKVDNALLYFVAAYTLVPENIFTNNIDGIKQLLVWFMKVRPRDPKKPPASNLLYNGEFQTEDQLVQLMKSGFDISRLDPPSGSFWENNEIEDYDPTDETYMGEQLLPKKSIRVPEFTYMRFGYGTIKVKAFWENEQGKKMKVNIRSGREVHTSVVTTHLARALGYHSVPTYFRDKVKINLGEASFSEFVNQWKSLNGGQHGGTSSYIEKINGENAIYLYNVSIEAYPTKEKYRRMGRFRTGRNGFGNRREFRSIFMYLALIAQQDTGDDQIRVDSIWDDKNKTWRPKFFFADTGYTMGSSVWWNNLGAANMYPYEIVSRDKKGAVRVWWAHGGYNPKTFTDMTFEDAKWIVRRMSRLSERQLAQILEASGWPEAVRAIYLERIKSRINDMVSAFNLTEEGVPLHKVKSKIELHRKYPDLINEKGYLTTKIETLPNTKQPLLGNRFTPIEDAITYGLNFFNKKLASATSKSITKSKNVKNLGYTMTSYGIGLHGSRHIDLNEFMGEGQGRYKATDTLNFTIPLGLIGNHLTTPVAVNINYQVVHTHSYPTLKEAETKRFFKWINPFSYKDIRKNLMTGDHLQYRHSIVGSIGRLSVSPMDRIELTLAPLSLSGTVLKEISIQRPFENMIEVVDVKYKDSSISSAIDLQLFLQAAAGASFKTENKTIRVFRLESGKENQSLGLEKIQSALQSYWLSHDSADLEKIASPILVDENTRTTSFNFGLFVWNWFVEKSKKVIEYMTGDEEISGEAEIGANKSLVFSRKFVSNYGRGISRDWNENIFIDRDAPKAIEIPIDLIFAPAATEGRSHSVSIEAVANEKLTDFKEIDLGIDFKFVDKWCNRDEYASIQNFFNQKVYGDNSGKPYLSFEIPEGVKRISPFLGQMHWQITKPGLDILVAKLHEPEVLNLYASAEEYSYKDMRPTLASYLSRYLKPIDEKLDDDTKRILLDKKLKSLLSLVRSLVGIKGADLHNLRKIIPEDKIWVVTRLFDVSRPEIPGMFKNGDFYAPEIGKFQGQKFSDRFRFKVQVTPHMITPALISRELDPSLMGVLDEI